MDINASRGMHEGASEDKIRAIDQAATSPLFDEVERAAIALENFRSKFNVALGIEA